MSSAFMEILFFGNRLSNSKVTVDISKRSYFRAEQIAQIVIQ